MHKDFYASGFIYNCSTRQILLQQKKSDSNQQSLWYVFGAEGNKTQTPEIAFQNIIQKLLSMKIKRKSILPVYSYFSNELNKDHFVLYTELKKIKKISPARKTEFNWFTFKDMRKLQITDQLKQDLVVLERVIEAKQRLVLDS